MIKTWSAVFFISYLSGANAALTNVPSDIEEREPGVVLIARSDEFPEEKGDGSPTETLGSSLIDPDIVSSSSSNKNEASGPPGPSRLSLNPKNLEIEISYPVSEVTWWERWWLSLSEWLLGTAK